MDGFTVKLAHTHTNCRLFLVRIQRLFARSVQGSLSNSKGVDIEVILGVGNDCSSCKRFAYCGRYFGSCIPSAEYWKRRENCRASHFLNASIEAVTGVIWNERQNQLGTPILVDATRFKDAAPHRDLIYQNFCTKSRIWFCHHMRLLCVTVSWLTRMSLSKLHLWDWTHCCYQQANTFDRRCALPIMNDHYSSFYLLFVIAHDRE